MENVKPPILITQNPEATRRVGESLGRGLQGGEVIGLVGELGSGKTCFVQGMAEGLNISPEEISSPTFTLIHEHLGRLFLAHVDLFRLEHPEAVEGIGLMDYYGEDRVTVIEWADRALSLLPPDALQIRFSFRPEGGRVLRFIEGNDQGRRWVRRWAESFGNSFLKEQNG